MKPIYFTPIFKEKIWGGNKIKNKLFSFAPSNNVGEAWILSAHESSSSQITYPEEYQHYTLQSLYSKFPALFGNSKHKRFPLLIKIIDAKEDLSVQVHPNDKNAELHPELAESVKNECWFILSAEKDAKVILGHHAKNREEFLDKLSNNSDELFIEYHVKENDFINVPAGTLHAIKGGLLILEVQQNSDTTYRVFDYNRKDKNGKKRELHQNEALDNLSFPQEENVEIISTPTSEGFYTLLHSEHFSVSKLNVEDSYALTNRNKYSALYIIEGEGELTIDNSLYPIKKGDSILIPYGCNEVVIKGRLKIIISETNEEPRNDL